MRTILDYIGVGTIFALLALGIVLIVSWIVLGIEMAREYLAKHKD